MCSKEKCSVERYGCWCVCLPMHVQGKMTEREHSELCTCCPLSVEYPHTTLLSGHLFSIILVLLQGKRLGRAKKLVCWVSNKTRVAEVVWAGEEWEEKRTEIQNVQILKGLVDHTTEFGFYFSLMRSHW